MHIDRRPLTIPWRGDSALLRKLPTFAKTIERIIRGQAYFADLIICARLQAQINTTQCGISYGYAVKFSRFGFVDDEVIRALAIVAVNPSPLFVVDTTCPKHQNAIPDSGSLDLDSTELVA